MNAEEAIAWVLAAQAHGIRPGLRTTQRLLAALDLAVDGRSGPAFLHVAGTNGKGSVCALLASICRAAGLRTGLYTSPHLLSYAERIQVNGVPISGPHLAEGLSRLRELTEEWTPAPTFFELTTALALWHFQAEGVEIAIIETGLGGRHDATNVVTPLASIITRIDLDHQGWLGSTLPAIAMEKAGIIKPGLPVLTLPQQEEVQTVLLHMAGEKEAPISFVISPLAGVPLALAGSHQRWNAALAVHALDAAGLHVGEEAILQGLQEVHWPGRFQRLGRLTLDGAHNPAAATQLAETWRETHGSARATIILGVLGDKEAAGLIAALAPIAARLFTVPVRNERTLSAEALEALAHQTAPELEVVACADYPSALGAAEEWPEPILLTGSLFLVGEALAQAQGEEIPYASLQ